MEKQRQMMLVAFLLSMILLACGSHTPTRTAPEEFSRGDQVPEDVDQESFVRGRALAMTECTGCHRYFYPREYTSDEWRRIIRKKTKRLSLIPKESEDLELFFRTASETARRETIGSFNPE